MALTDPLQWVIIAVVVVVFLLYGPKKIPELARSLGRARNEFQAASKSAEEVTETLKDPNKILQTLDRHSQAPAPAAPAPAPAEDSLLGAARKMGIATEGKTTAQISEEIIRRASSGPPVSGT
jgi:sec-independent protein translocase protein TatA